MIEDRREKGELTSLEVRRFCFEERYRAENESRSGGTSSGKAKGDVGNFGSIKEGKRVGSRRKRRGVVCLEVAANQERCLY